MPTATGPAITGVDIEFRADSVSGLHGGSTNSDEVEHPCLPAET